MFRNVCFLSVLLAVVLQPISVLAQDDAKRSITRVAGDVYRFQNNFHYALVVLTEEGVIITDSINKEAASWLKEEIGKMTDKPITHLIYSHSHGDHASGGKVLAEGAEVIAQKNAPGLIDGVSPTVRFSKQHEIVSGSKKLELTWLGSGHGEDLIAVVVRPENVAFITDVASPKRLPWRNMGGANIDDWINQIRVVESLDFEIFAPAHGNIGVKSDATDARVYMETLKTEVLAGLTAGKSVSALVDEVTLDEYKDWQQYDSWRELNIQGMAGFLERSGQVK